MNNRRKLQRKIIIGAIMALLLLPMSYLAQPAASGDPGSGGVLATMRSEERLAQSNLGEIDPTSEAMKLACLGLRGVYATVLWGKSHQYKEQENWAALAATLEQMTKLQPNFVSVWRFQGWNQAYNLSVEMDDYQYRYYWVTRGIEFIDRGQSYNENDVMLVWDEGWYTAQKIGRADEVVQFRRLFSQDEFNMVEDIFGADQKQAWEQDNLLDNWYVGRDSFLDAIQLYESDATGETAKRTMALNVALFMSEPTKCSMRFAGAREKDGELGDPIRDKWRKAYAEWTDGYYPGADRERYELDPRLAKMPFGDRLFNFIPSVPQASMLSLDNAIAERDRILAEMVPQEVLQELIDKRLADELVAADSLQGPDKERRVAEIKMIQQAIEDFDSLSTDDKYRVAPQLPYYTEIVPDTLLRAEAVENNPQYRASVNEHLDEARAAHEMVVAVRQGRQLVNYGYWADRCQAEASQLGSEARSDFYLARQAQQQDELTKAQELYESGFQKWRTLLDEGDGEHAGYYLFVDDGETGHDMMEHARRYEELLDRQNKPFPNPFILRDVIDNRNPIPPIGDTTSPEVQAEPDAAGNPNAGENQNDGKDKSADGDGN